MHRVMEVVVPDRVQPQPVLGQRGDDADIVLVGLADDDDLATVPLADLVGGGGDVGQNVPGRDVDDRLDRIQPQAVQPELVDPQADVVDDEPADLVAAARVDVEPVAPRRADAAGEVRAELGQVVALRPEVVVDAVHQHRQPHPVGGIDQPAEGCRPAVGVLHGERVDAVVAPAAIAGELAHGQQLDRVDAQFGQVGQLPDRRIQCALGRERADVQLVDHQVSQRHPGEVVPPVEGGGLDGAHPVDAVGLMPRPRVRPDRPAVKRVAVPRAAGHPGHGDGPQLARVDRVADAAHRMPLLGLADGQIDAAGIGGPDDERRRVAVEMDTGCWGGGHRRKLAGCPAAVADCRPPVAEFR